MLNKVAAYIEKHQLLQAGKTYLVALSGGADSVALLLVLQQLGYSVEAAHCNFRLRGDESQRDEDFVKRLCQERNVPLHLVHFETSLYASLHKISIEMAARELRYRYFEQLRVDLGADGICVAHHQDDSIETVLMNLIRGTGIHGLTGIRPRHGHVLRPLLCVGRVDIEQFLRSLHQPYVTDSTNLVDDMTRNKIRLRLLPVLREISPAAPQGILQTAEWLGEAARVYDASIAEAKNRLFRTHEISVSQLLAEPSPEALLYELLAPYGFGSSAVAQIVGHLHAPTGKLWASATHEVLADRGRLIVEPRQEPLPELKIPETGTFLYRQSSRFRVEVLDGAVVDRSADCACLDASTVSFPLHVRPLRPGDAFVPLGMTGRRLVSDFLTDRKFTLFQKRRQLVVTNAEDAIVWLVGLRPDNRFRVTPSTRQTLFVRYGVEIQ